MSILSWLSSSHWMSLGPSPVDTPNVSLGTSVGRAEAAAPDPTTADVLYVGGSNGGPWKTGVWNNDPPVWIVTGDDQPSLNFSGYHPLVVHPADNKIVLGLVSGAGGGVLKSTDHGLGWTLLANSEFEGAAVGSLAVHPTNTSILYVSVWYGASGGGVYKSTDGGLNWSNLTTFHSGMVADVVIAKFSPETLYAGMVPNGTNGVNTSGVYKSTDAGATWHLQAGGLPSGAAIGGAIRLESGSGKGVVYVTIFHNDGPNKVSVQRYKTTDDGGSWKALGATSSNAETRSWHVLLGVHPKDDNHVFANDAYSLFESTNGGTSWSRAENIGDDWVNIAFDANGNAAITADRNVYRYEVKTKKWTSCCGNLALTQFYDITIDPQNVNVTYGIAQDHVAGMKFDQNEPWNILPNGGGETGKVLVDPGNSKRLYISNPLDVTRFVIRSVDGGQTWTTILTNNAFSSQNYSLAYATQKAFVMDPGNPQRLLLGTNQVFETTNATANNPTWVAISNVLSSAPQIAGQFIRALAIAPSNTKTIYAATGDGHIWVTQDNGSHWNQRDTGIFGNGAAVELRINPANPNEVFAVTNGAAGHNVWHLQPASLQWVNISGNLPNNLGAASLFVDWQYSIPALFAGMARGVYHSVNLGQTWSKFAVDMPNTTVTDFESFPADNVLEAATSGRGMWAILIAPSKISGIVFDDSDSSGTYKPQDKGISGVTVFLDANGNGSLDASEYRATTDKDGNFVFDKVPPGTYTLMQAPLLGYTQTTPAFKNLSVSGSDVTGKNFGVRPLVLKVPPGPVGQIGQYTTLTDLHILPGRLPGEPIAGTSEHENQKMQSGNPKGS